MKPLILVFENHVSPEGKEYIQNNLQSLKEKGYKKFVYEHPPILLDELIETLRTTLQNVNNDLDPLKNEVNRMESEKITNNVILFQIKNNIALMENQQKSLPFLITLFESIKQADFDFHGADKTASQCKTGAANSITQLWMNDNREKRDFEIANELYNIAQNKEEAGVIGLFGANHAPGIQKHLTQLAPSFAKECHYIFVQKKSSDIEGFQKFNYEDMISQNCLYGLKIIDSATKLDSCLSMPQNKPDNILKLTF